MRDTCRRCSLLFDRGEPDYFIGSYTVNFIAAELVIVAVGLIVVVATWPDVPWDPLRWGLLAMMVPFPILTYPFAKTIWLAIDLVFRPLRISDLAGHGENLPEREGE